MQDQEKLVILLTKMAEFYGHDMSDGALEMYLEVFSKFHVEQIAEAAKIYMADENNTRFPMPPHKIMSVFKPKEPDHRDVATQLARQIYGLTASRGSNWRLGYYFGGEQNYFEGKNGTRFSSFKDAVVSELGEVGWISIQKFGGWESIVDSANDMPEGMFIAQTRDHIQSAMTLSKNGIDVALLDMPSPKTKQGLISVNNSIMQLLDASKREI